MPEYTPAWLDVADVKAQLRLSGADTADDDLVVRCAAAVEPQVQRARSDAWVYYDPDDPYPPDPPPPGWPVVYEPDAEVYQAAVMLAARLVRRRNSPGGVESFGESVTYVSRYDPDIGRALHSGSWALPGVG
jgi:hypothetical protein